MFCILVLLWLMICMLFGGRVVLLSSRVRGRGVSKISVFMFFSFVVSG